MNILCKIKSDYILKRIFSLVIDCIKLGLINYNKKLQKRTKVSIEDYKKLCKTGKIEVRNGKGKEFELDTNKLIYEGENLNWKRHGKGTEYNLNNEIKFIGEFIEGKKVEGKGYNNEGNLVFILYKNGKGGEFYNNGRVRFEGEYFNDKRWNGKGYNNDGNVDFEIKNGKGKGKIYYSNEKLFFEGEYLNGNRNGQGKEYNISGNLVYEGEYVHNERHGKGKEYYLDGKIKAEGYYLYGKMNGKGKEYNCNGELVFEGEFLNGKKNGKGKEYYGRDKSNFLDFSLSSSDDGDISLKILDEDDELLLFTKSLVHIVLDFGLFLK